MYGPSKHAITGLTEVLRQEFQLKKKTGTKITSISPGVVDTEILDKTIRASPDLPMLRSEDVADAVTYCIQTPPNVQIHELIIKPVGEKF
ncbi:farnesol dehydrogenase-like [Drosophila obscura]|nr:farnesol dehydrogenase-like [Drosophila obscura]